MIFVDTGAWFAAFVPTNERHAPATQLLSTNREAMLTTDYVVDETLTLGITTAFAFDVHFRQFGSVAVVP